MAAAAMMTPTTRPNCGQEAGEAPPARTRRQERSEQRHRPDRVDLSPVRTGEDRGRLQHPEPGGQDRRGVPGLAPHERHDQEDDADVGGNADRLDRET